MNPPNNILFSYNLYPKGTIEVGYESYAGGMSVGTPNKSVVNQRFVDHFGYNTHYFVKSEGGEKITWTWKIWWAERDEKGFYKPDSSTDGVTYSKMDDAKVALQERFRINADEVTTVKWRGNLTEYN